MLHHSPLKTLILSSNEIEINAIKAFTKKFPDVFKIHRITGDIVDFRHILSAESFDLTFFDESIFPLNNISQVGVDRFGIIVFKNKKTLFFDNGTSLSNRRHFYLGTPIHSSLPNLIRNLRAEIEEKKMKQILAPPFERKIGFRKGRQRLFIAPESIIYAHIKGNWTNLFYLELKEPKVLSLWMQLTELESKLNSSLFFRTNRSYIINIKFFQELSSSGKIITLAAPGMKWVFKVPLSERRRTELRKRQI